MKKLILTLTLTMAVVTASFHAQVRQWIMPEPRTSKNINLNVNAGSAYQSGVYAGTVARLHVTVTKVKGNQVVLLQKNEYPDWKLNGFPAGLLNQTTYIPNVVDSKEQIVIHYTSPIPQKAVCWK